MSPVFIHAAHPRQIKATPGIQTPIMQWKGSKLQKKCSAWIGAFLSPGPSTQGQKVCRHVTLGRGGTFNLGGSRPEHVRFSEGDTGVGVFFMIADNRCFAANIEITHETKENSNGHASVKPIDERWQRAHAVAVREIRKLLDAESKGNGWGPDRTARMRETLVVLGRGARRRADTTTDYIRWAVSDVVQEWLKIPEPERKEPELYGALVVKLSGTIKETAPKSVSARKWKLENVQTDAGAWRFAVVS